jgi:hypothetical protein
MASGEMYPEFGIWPRARWTMWVADKMNLGNDGNGMPDKWNDCRRRGADPPKNVSGSTGTFSSVDPRKKFVKTGSGPFIAATNFFNAGTLMWNIWISAVRSRCSTAAMRLSTPFSSNDV